MKVERDGSSLLDADTITVDYTLRDLLPGGKRRYGLRAIDVVHPVLTVRRRGDGTLNITNPPQVNVGGNPKPAAAAAPGTPFQLRVRVTDGVAMLLDPYRFHAIARSQRVDGIEVDAQIDTAARTRYRVSGAYRVASRPYPIVATGTLDTPRAYALHVVRAQALPLSPIVDYFIDSDVATMRAGTARAIAVGCTRWAWARLSFARRRERHRRRLRAGGTAPAAARPARTRGPLRRRRCPAADRRQPRRSAPAYCRRALRLVGAATVDRRANARPARAFARCHHIFGRVAGHRRDDGGRADREPRHRPGHPGALRHRSTVVRRYRRRRGGRHGWVLPAVAQRRTVHAHYGAVAARAYGAIDLGRTTQTTVVALAGGPAASLPYAAQLVPRSRIAATAILTGTNARFGAQGFVEASGPDRLTAPFTLDQYGRGAFGPLALVQQSGGSALGTFYLARDRSESAFWVDARRLAIAAPAHRPSFEHLHLPALPALAGNISATVGGAGPPSAFALVGRVHVRDLQFGPVRIAEATADLGGSPSDLRAGTVRATGPWGRFAGSGGSGRPGSRSAVAIRGRSRAPGVHRAGRWTRGARSAGRDPRFDRGKVVQTSGGSTAGASVHGIPLDRVAGTLTAGAAGVRILAASAGVAGGGLVAAGTATHGSG